MTGGCPSGIPPGCLRLLLYYNNTTSGLCAKPAESSLALRAAAHGMLANAAAVAIGRRGLEERTWMEVAGTDPRQLHLVLGEVMAIIDVAVALTIIGLAVSSSA